MPSTVDAPVLRQVRPTLRVSGQDAPLLERALLQLVLRSDDSGLASLEMELLNWQAEGSGEDRGLAAGHAFEDEALLGWGTPITVDLAARDGGTVRAFEGEITGQEYVHPGDQAPRLVVLAEDRLARLRLLRRSARHEGQSADAVLRRLADLHGLSLELAQPFGAAQDWLQLGETDLGFARRLCRLHGQRLRLEGRTLHVEPGQEAAPGAPPTLQLERDLVQLRVLADLSHQRGAVVASGFDLQRGEAYTERVDQLSPALTQGAGRNGPALLRQALGEAAPDEPLWQHPAGTAAEARDWAQQALDERARRFLRLRATLLPAGELQCGAAFTLAGAGPRFSTDYVCSRVEHRFDTAQGLRTQVEAWGARLGDPGTEAGGGR